MTACTASGTKAATGACAGIRMAVFRRLIGRVFTRENTWALLLCLILSALTVLTADIAPTWIYQGF
jgi:hypothetical protein